MTDAELSGRCFKPGNGQIGTAQALNESHNPLHGPRGPGVECALRNVLMPKRCAANCIILVVFFVPGELLSED